MGLPHDSQGLPHRSRKRVSNRDNEPPSKRRFLGKDGPSKDMHDPMDMDDAKSNTESSDTVICYGALFSAKIRAATIQDSTFLPWISFFTFAIVRRNNSFVLIHPAGDGNKEFADLDVITSRYLNALQCLQTLRFEAVMSSSNLAKIARKGHAKGTILDITVNILGPETSAQTAGGLLAKADCCLQHPAYLEQDIQYKNPHYFYVSGTMTDLRHFIGPVIKETDSLRASRRIDQVLESLGDAAVIGSAVLDDAVLATIRRCLLNTNLKDHQITGIRFIMGRENASICADMARELLGLIDPILIPGSPLPGLGGILADVMGLGKTLTMLSAIACSKQGIPDAPSATLVVLPSRQLLDVWDSEIKRHFQPGTLSVALFHQGHRAKMPNELLGYDVVLTTYHTLAADWKGLGVLQKASWLRVILDEAHWIRNQATGLFKAAANLKAERRWCMTGTPIQNSLDDLRSLLRFLQQGPLSESKQFKKYIHEPIAQRPDYDGSFRNLQLLLRNMCLRRTEALLDLPPSTTEIVKITLTPEESAAYRRLEVHCQEEYERQLCTKSKVNTSALLFDTILKRRRLCNHGTYLAEPAEPAEPVEHRSPSPSGRPRRSKRPASSMGPTDDSCVLCGTQDEDVVASLDGADECPLCARTLTGDSTLKGSGSSTWLTVPESPSRHHKPRRVGKTPSPTRASMSPSAQPIGHSSKLTAVTENIYSSCAIPGNKNLVFTSWRTTLNLLGMLLSQKGIPFLRIDGTVASTNRTAILSQFNTDPTIPVLLLTIDSGAVGLTITSANHVHIVEPIYNPATEAQAIARVLRMGQTRPVTIIKYITEKTVEPNIVTLQERKRRLAKFSLDDQVKDGDSDSLDELKFILDTSRA
ncbi:SNF2 family N-terminal domain-containing protein [Cladorrhinum sp. PSN259]|nr:SNF2 family N-terminal domain-containing protein [Cladorrhinum sp. PSN259]